MSILVETFLNKEHLELQLEDLGLEKKEQEALLKTIEDIARYRILNVVLDKLESKDKEMFLRQLHLGAEELMVESLREKIEGVEEILRKEIKEVEMEVLADISQLKQADD